MDKFYLYNEEAKQYFQKFNRIQDNIHWFGWRDNDIEVTRENSSYGLIIQTRFTLEEVFKLEDETGKPLMQYLKEVTE